MLVLHALVLHHLLLLLGGVNGGGVLLVLVLEEERALLLLLGKREDLELTGDLGSHALLLSTLRLEDEQEQLAVAVAVGLERRQDLMERRWELGGGGGAGHRRGR